jgi:hypothetical protein
MRQIVSRAFRICQTKERRTFGSDVPHDTPLLSNVGKELGCALCTDHTGIEYDQPHVILDHVIAFITQ